jgi:predicted PurR-regulated permease PerM
MADARVGRQGYRHAYPEGSRMTDRPTPLWLQRWFQLLLGSLVLLTVASLAVPWLLGLVYALRSVLLPLVIAVGLAYIFNPVVTWANRRLRLPRWLGTAGVMLSGLMVALLLAMLILPPLVAQGVELIRKAKSYPQQISQLIDQQTPGDNPGVPGAQGVPGVPGAATAPVGRPAPEPAAQTQTPATDDGSADGTLRELRVMIDEALGPERATEVLAKAADWLSELDWGQVAQFILASLDVGAGVVGSAINLTSYFALSAIIIGFCFFFFSWKLDKLTAWFVPFIPIKHRDEVLEVVGKMDKSVAAFIRGRLIQAGVMAVVLSIGWWMAGVPSWLLLGVLSGALNLVPFAAVVGFLAALVLALVDSVAGGGFTIWVLIWPTLVYVLAQGLDGWVVEPIVQGKATDLDPVSVLLAVMIGGALAGLLGMLIAIPAAACLKILSREVVLPRLRAMAAEGG